jgi:CBS domain-containing protein
MGVIRDVMSTDMVKVSPTTTVAEAATIMSTKKVGSALVMEDDDLVGIFTERDVLRAVASEFDAEHHQVGAFMTADPNTIAPDMDSADGLASMFAFGFRHMPVVEDGKVVGVVSMRDLTPRG